MSDTSDVDTVYNNIRNQTIKATSVRILSSKRPQSLSLLRDFANIEEIHCSIFCLMSQLDTLSDLISKRHKLSQASFVICIPEQGSNFLSHEERDEQTPPPKRRRLNTESETSRQRTSLVREGIRDLVKKLGRRMRYINISITVASASGSFNPTVSYSTILLNKGTFCVVSDDDEIERNESNREEGIFQALVETGCLSGIVTKGDSNYNLSNVSYIPELTIISRVFSEYNPLNESYLKDLISRSEVVKIIYEPDTIDDMHVYSELIRDGSSGTLKRINAIVPVSDVESHITLNTGLEEIYTLVRDQHDLGVIKHLVETYSDRPITYHVHYYRSIDLDHCSCLKNTTTPSDIVFKDIATSLMY